MTSPRTPATTPPRRERPSIESGSAPALHLELARKVEGLPKDLGVALIGLGVIGIAIPGPIPPGASFVLLGLVFLRPGLIVRFAGPIARRFPRLVRFLIGFVDDLRLALERRYPGSAGC